MVPTCELLLGISLRPPSDIVHEDVRLDRRHEVADLVLEDRLDGLDHEVPSISLRTRDSVVNSSRNLSSLRELVHDHHRFPEDQLPHGPLTDGPPSRSSSRRP